MSQSHDLAIESIHASQYTENLIGQLEAIYSNTTRSGYNIAGDISELAEDIVIELDKDADMLIGLVHLRSDLNHATIRTIQNTIFSLLTAKRLNWETARIHTLACACLTQNIGMYQLQNDLAQKDKNELTDVHFQQIRLHPAKGARMLASMGVDDHDWLSAVALHHEKLDGRGYPYGYVAKDVPLEARLMAVADRYGSMITPRTNRESGNPSQIMRYLLLSKRKEYDKKLSQALIMELGIYPPGSVVALCSGEVALVVRRGEDYLHPHVQAIWSPEDKPYPAPIARDTYDEDYEITRFISYPQARQLDPDLFWGSTSTIATATATATTKAANEIENDLLPQEMDIPMSFIEDS